MSEQTLTWDITTQYDRLFIPENSHPATSTPGFAKINIFHHPTTTQKNIGLWLIIEGFPFLSQLKTKPQLPKPVSKLPTAAHPAIANKNHGISGKELAILPLVLFPIHPN